MCWHVDICVNPLAKSFFRHRVHRLRRAKSLDGQKLLPFDFEGPHDTWGYFTHPPGGPSRRRPLNSHRRLWKRLWNFNRDLFHQQFQGTIILIVFDFQGSPLMNQDQTKERLMFWERIPVHFLLISCWSTNLISCWSRFFWLSKLPFLGISGMPLRDARVP